MNKYKACFLDRDGVLNENRANYVRSIADLKVFPFTAQACKLLTQADYLPIIVSNQAAINKGLLTHDQVAAINQHLIADIQSGGGLIHANYYCPHRIDEQCSCRKPEAGMLLQAAEEYHLSLQESYFIGDAVSDVQAALKAGVSPILVRTGRGKKQEQVLAGARLEGTLVFDDVLRAVEFIVANTGRLA